MAKTSMKVKQSRPAKFSTRAYTRCKICGRPHAYPAENRVVAEAFLKEHASFLPEKIEIGVTRTVEEPDYMLTMTPKAGASDGFFAAAFRKKQG